MKTKRNFVSSELISSPGYKFKISNVLLQKKEIDFNISFYEGILKENPCLVECLDFLGNAYTATGMYEKGLEIDKRLSRLRPNDSVVIYNLACSYSLTEEIDLA
ncbi:MAG: tetratricopeptide repeat protein, partial [Candidatus Anammoxibacter sp.]